MKPNKKIFKSLIFIGLIAVAAAVLISTIYATRPAKPMVERLRDPRVPVRTIPVEEKPFRRKLTLLGTARAKSRAQVAAEVGGNIVWISEDCEPGRKVRKGDELVRIDRRPYEIALEQAVASFAEAEAAVRLREITNQTEEAKLEETKEELEAAANELERKERLFEKGVISASEVDTQRSSYSAVRKTYLDVLSKVNSAKALLKQDEAQLARSRAQRDQAALDLERTAVEAPFSGEIASRSVDVGNHISANTVAFEVVDFDTVIVDVQVPSRYLEVVREDAVEGVRSDVNVTLHARDGRISRGGRLVHLSPSAEAGTRLFAAEIFVENPPQLSPILPGQFVEAVIVETTPRQAVVIPYAAMTQDSGGLYVFVLDEPEATTAASTGADNGTSQAQPSPRARKIYVDIMWEQGEEAVVDGLTTGEPLVVFGQEDLVDGAEVEIVGAQDAPSQDRPGMVEPLTGQVNGTAGGQGAKG